MKRREFLSLAGAAAAFPRAALAQAKVPRVALVSGAVPVGDMQIGRDEVWTAILSELAAKGFVESRSINYERYLLNASVGAVEDNARRVLQSRPDAILWSGATPTALAAISMDKSTAMIVSTGDLLGQGVVSNLAHPGGNVTGVSTTASADAEGKLLSLLAEAIPRAKTFAYTNSGLNGLFQPSKDVYVMSVTAAANKLGLGMSPIVYAPGGGEPEWIAAFQGILDRRAEMVVLGTDTPLTTVDQQALVAGLAVRARLPSIAPFPSFCQQGGLMAYGSSRIDTGVKAADYVALVLKGAKPGDLPVLQPTAFDFVVNLKTAKAIGVTIPQSVLLQATQVIE